MTDDVYSAGAAPAAGLNVDEKGALVKPAAEKKSEDAPLRAETKVETIGPCKSKLSIEVHPDEVAKAIRDSMWDLKKQAILPGFRKGHAPVALIEKRFGADIRKEVKSNLVSRGYQKAVEEHKLEPISDPDLNLDAIDLSDDKPLVYELTIEVWPDFPLNKEDYEGLALEKPSARPSAADVEAEIQSLRVRTTTFEEVKDEGAQASDILVCDYSVTSGGKEVATAKDAGIRPEDEVVGRLKVLGSKPALTGKKAGDSVNLDFTIDQDYHQEEFRGAAALLSVNIKGVRRPKAPDLTDAWAKELGFESLEELKTIVTRNVEAAKESQADAALRGQIYLKLLDMLKFDLPEDAVRRQQKDVFRRERLGLQYRGATEEDLAKISDKLEEASLEKAQKDLKLFFILSKIARKEGIEASEADVDMRVAELAARYRTTVAKMRDHLKREDMLAQLSLEVREEKTVAHILSKAKISDAQPAEPAASPEEPKAKQPRKPRVKKSEDAEAKEDS